MGVSSKTVRVSERKLQAEGFGKLAELGVRGRPRQLSDEQLAELAQLLKQGAIAAGYSTEMWTLKRIGTLIEEKFGVHLVPSSVWRLLAGMGWSVQRPTGRARERDEGAIRNWKAKRWPALKKSPRGSDESSSS